MLPIVQVEALDGNDDLENAKGAFVNVAYWASGEDAFRQTVIESFSGFGFKVLEIDDVENEKKISIVNPENAEKLKLMEELKEGAELAWGIFHSYD